jgi:hypothetical protein
VAYGCVAMTGIDRSAAPQLVAKGAPVRQPRHRERPGSARSPHSRRAHEKAACRAVVVTALNANARDRWERFGFHPFEPDDPERLDLYLLTSEIEATLKRAR